jgi:Fe-S-cluster containining protein
MRHLRHDRRATRFVLEEVWAHNGGVGMSTQAAVIPSCLACGTCCFSELATYVPVVGTDHARLGDQVDQLTVFDGHRCHMRMHDGHCAALVVDVTSQSLVCSIYEARPDVCRELERGGPACRGELHEKRERPLLLLRSRGRLLM